MDPQTFDLVETGPPRETFGETSLAVFKTAMETFDRYADLVESRSGDDGPNASLWTTLLLPKQHLTEMYWWEFSMHVNQRGFELCRRAVANTQEQNLAPGVLYFVYCRQLPSVEKCARKEKEG